MKAIMDRVLIRPDEPQRGLILIEDDRETKSGVVVSAGSDVKSVKKGDHVIYFKWDDLPAPDGLTVVLEKSLLGVYEE